MDYFKKIEERPNPDLAWNLPETKKGTIKIIGGNSNGFRAEIKTAEFLTTNYPIKTLELIFPDSLRLKLPDLSNIIYVGATDSGSFGDATALNKAMSMADYNLLLGDLSKNAITARVIHDVLKDIDCPILVTRDAIDLVTENNPEPILMNSYTVFLASMLQLQKIFRVVYYPKMLLLSQSLMQVVDALHKFTLSYPIKIITLHNEQILIAENGKVRAVPLEKTGYQPLTFWGGEIAAKIVALNLYNPNNFLDATVCAFFA